MGPAIFFHGWTLRRIHLLRGILILIMFAAIAQFASFALIQGHVVAFYGVQAEDVSFAWLIAYVGIATALPLQFKVAGSFNVRTYLLLSFLLSMTLNLGFTYTQNLWLFSVLRFFTGVTTCLVVGRTLVLLFTTLPETKRVLIGTSFFFSLILIGGPLVSWGASWVVDRMDWTAFYYVLMGLQLLAMAFVIAVFKGNTPQAKIPPADWPGAMLFAIAGGALAFAMIYGPRYYWLADPPIEIAAVLVLIFTLLFIWRQRIISFPLIDLVVFKYRRFIFGLLLLIFFYGVKDSLNLIYGYAVSVKGWSAQDIVEATTFNVVGIVLATIISVIAILQHKRNLIPLILVGFLVLFAYHLYFSTLISHDLSVANLSIPIFTHGFACGLLFVPISILCITALPPQNALTGIVICTYARFIASLNSIAGFFTLQLVCNRKHTDVFIANLNFLNQQFVERRSFFDNFLLATGFSNADAGKISNTMLAKSLATQAQLATIRSIFLLFTAMIGLMILFLFIYLLWSWKQRLVAQRVS